MVSVLVGPADVDVGAGGGVKSCFAVSIMTLKVAASDNVSDNISCRDDVEFKSDGRLKHTQGVSSAACAHIAWAVIAERHCNAGCKAAGGMAAPQKLNTARSPKVIRTQARLPVGSDCLGGMTQRCPKNTGGP